LFCNGVLHFQLFVFVLTKVWIPLARFHFDVLCKLLMNVKDLLLFFYYWWIAPRLMFLCFELFCCASALAKFKSKHLNHLLCIALLLNWNQKLKVTCCEFCSYWIKSKVNFDFFLCVVLLLNQNQRFFTLLYWIILLNFLCCALKYCRIRIFFIFVMYCPLTQSKVLFVFVLHVKLLLNPKSKPVLKAINYSIHIIH
jgi:hypothetical protein